MSDQEWDELFKLLRKVGNLSGLNDKEKEVLLRIKVILIKARAIDMATNSQLKLEDFLSILDPEGWLCG